MTYKYSTLHTYVRSYVYIIPYMVKLLRGNFCGRKLLWLEYKINIHRKTFVVAASFNNESLI